jgi:hypothetical protein
MPRKGNFKEQGEEINIQKEFGDHINMSMEGININLPTATPTH